MLKITPGFLKTLTLIVIVGFIAGAMGAALAWSMLMAYRGSLLTETAPTLPRVRTTVGVEESSLLAVVQEKVLPALVEFYGPNDGVAERYFPEDVVSRGAVITSDGWVLGERSLIKRYHPSRVRVGIGSLVYEPERVIEDTETGILFIKVDAKNLRAAAFGSSNAARVGEGSILVAGLDIQRKVYLERFAAPQFAKSDRLEAKYRLTDGRSITKKGGLVVDGAGAIVGILRLDTGQAGEVVLSDAISPLINSLLAEDRLSRPALGVRGLHLSGVRSPEGGRERGFLITEVIDESVAEEAGLLVNDIILKINDTLVNGQGQLSELLLAWKPGDKVDLRIVRGEEELVVSVILGERDVGLWQIE